MSDQRRKCLVKLNSYDQPSQGYFETFGNQERRDEANNPYVITVAIVELDDGRVVSVEPTNIKYINE
ncbi:hypothetical protein M2G36_22145 [Vibrio vulnificus]|uniref:hypothetical protein n=1 Tax=Vibrio TaxID=662 RepID=UPI000D65EC85|nr:MULTISPECIES: hypothetical protein [Vibrio]EIV8497388.1 hypothetical protein [Vibrio vulnificus]MCA3945192.1 hypothetical protein [Vibrio vulnificus]MCS0455400.1 hypothetical protein [Vibrio diabolicus]MCU8562448.1 hypothetical protein [Vibrio vulnificus]PWF68834.1 hypothetical protein CBX98_20890 [Vibrio sp. T9]